jgi:thiosulfate/3-mercaptopyruvate sulfurtransferase
LDASYTLPGVSPSAKEGFQARRIPGARFFDIETISDPHSALPHMLPSEDGFAAAMAALGLTPEDCLIIYGQGDIAMGPARAWWMFRVFGHNKVAVLNGGLKAWEKQGLQIHTAPPTPPSAAIYTTHGFRADLVADLACVRQAAETNVCPIYDARPSARFTGAQAEPRAGLRSGHIPGSLNIPAATLTDPETGLWPGPDVLRGKFETALSSTAASILTCGSGVTACALALALFTLGRPDAAVYDGSWAQWGAEDQGLPIAQGQ